MKKKNVCKVMIIVSVLSMFSGLFGCSGSKKYTADEVVSFYTSYSGMERYPVYSFALRKEDENWLFSASCYVGSRKEHYASFSSVQIPPEDAEGFLEIILEEGEIKRLRKYREPIHFFHISDAPMRISGMTFTDGSSIDKETAFGDKTLDYLYALADRHYEAAEKIEIKAVSVHSSCMDHSSSYSFTIEKEGDDWFFSFDAALNRSGAHTEVENQRIGESDAEEILRIVKEQQLVTRVKEYEEPPDNDIFALDETTYQTSFEFADGNSIYAPIDAGNELIDAFYRLAGVRIYQR